MAALALQPFCFGLLFGHLFIISEQARGVQHSLNGTASQQFMVLYQRGYPCAKDLQPSRTPLAANQTVTLAKGRPATYAARTTRRLEVLKVPEVDVLQQSPRLDGRSAQAMGPGMDGWVHARLIPMEEGRSNATAAWSGEGSRRRLTPSSASIVNKTLDETTAEALQSAAVLDASQPGVGASAEPKLETKLTGSRKCPKHHSATPFFQSVAVGFRVK
ncbi:hypothetical protein IWX90DRAFT_410704 [Phyllosticta citrichinensis]|uniref:SH3 domain-containing protein n=1 Tax=Phyllosticta citrichinensis TaxID=1130410 RepID=A0ABR1Y729_9PEZI